MSIKPVDFQVMLPRTSEVAKIHNSEQNKGQMLQEQQTVVVQNNVENSIRQVHSQDNVQEGKIREKEEKRERDKKEQKDEQKKKGNYNSKKKNEIIKTSTIDIKI